LPASFCVQYSRASRISYFVESFEDLQEAVMQTRMQPVGNLFARYSRIVRDLSAKLGKKMNLDVIGSNVEIDKNLLEALADPLTHMIRNSCDHGLETPAERLAAGKHEEGAG